MIDLKQMSRAELESFYDVAHDEYHAVCQQNESLKKKLAKAREALRRIEEGHGREGSCNCGACLEVARRTLKEIGE